jgi:hypothetical protein
MAAPTSGEENTVEDSDLKILNARRMVELKRKMNSALAAQRRVEAEKSNPPTKKELTPREIVLRALRERGDEVLSAAEASYPRETALILPKLADIIKEGKITTITGGELLQFFRAIGMRVSVKTTISVQDHGKFVDLAEKLKRQND